MSAVTSVRSPQLQENIPESALSRCSQPLLKEQQTCFLSVSLQILFMQVCKFALIGAWPLSDVLFGCDCKCR